MAKNLDRLAAAVLLFGFLLSQAFGVKVTAFENGVLLLSNGQVLEGKVSREEDHYYVAMDHGEIQLRACDVEFACFTLDEAYRKKRSSIQGGGVDEHIKLCQWCVQHELVDAAARELATVIATGSKHPMVEVLGRKLELMTQPTERPKVEKRSKLTTASNDKLDRIVREMPPGTIAEFARSVQPLLLNGCATGECHGAGAKNGFRLMRVRPGMPLSRRLTQRNVCAVLKWVDKQRPMESPLLTVPIRPHGNAKSAIFTGRDLLRYKKLVDWVTHVASAGEIRDVQEQSLPENEQANKGFGFSELPTAQIKSQQQSHEELTGDGGGLGIGRAEPKRANVPTGFVPKDPFDPNIFNRQFHKTKF